MSLFDSPAVFLYHRVSPEVDPAYPPTPPRGFERHCRFFKRAYNVLHPNELIDRVVSGKSLRGCCCISFDDGYRDVVDYAGPILAKYGLFAIDFLVEECVTTGQPTWNLRLNRLFFEGHFKPDLYQSAIGESPGPQIISFESVKHHLGGVDPVRRNQILEILEDGIALAPRPAMITAATLDGPYSERFVWGGHTQSHASLDQLSTEAKVREIAHSKTSLEAILGSPIEALAYPNDKWDLESRSLAAKAGYRAAFRVGQVRLHAGKSCDPYLIPRLDVGAHSILKLVVELAGVLGIARRLRSLLRSASGRSEARSSGV